MKKFVRALSPFLVGRLKAEPLFSDKLLPDMSKRKDAVFPAIRNDYVSFYYKGGGLFTYSKDGFKTHKKYAIAPENLSQNYIAESDLPNIVIKQSYTDAYDDVKDRCKAYGTLEASYVSELYGYSGLSKSPVILLDTEIAFSGEDYDNEDNRNKQSSRVDLLLYDAKERLLCFCEAKHFGNGEIWASEGNRPEVYTQVERYNKIIADRYDEILAEYKSYVALFNDLFGSSIPEPESIYPKTGLLIFGYDKYQREKIRRLLEDDGSLIGLPHYTTGSISPTTMERLFNALTKER